MKNKRRKREEGRGKRKGEKGETKRQSYIFVFFLSFFISLFPLPSFLSPCYAAQRAQQVQITAKVFKNKIKIGDELRLLIQVEHPRKYSIVPLSEKINVSPFEVKKMDASSFRAGQNRVKETFGFTLTVFELGDLKIPAIPVQYKDESYNVGEVRTDPIPVKVLSVGKKLTDKDDIRTIKGPVSLGLVDFRNWVLGILASLLSIFFITKVTRRWIRERKEAESRKPPHVRVRIELARLKDQGFLEENKVKEFYSGLSNILRNYMERAFKLEALERTTFEILEEMKTKNYDGTVTAKVKTVLEDTDLVKFAKYTPERALADRLETEILEVVDKTKPTEKDT